MIEKADFSDALERCREETLEWEPVYDEFVARLRDLKVGAGAPKVGDAFPGFALPDSRGARVYSSDLVESGPLVLSFNRGGWCPYCRTELNAWAERLPALAAVGGRFAAVTGEVGGRAEAMRLDISLDADVLCDIDHGLALSLGLAFHLGGDLRQRYLDCGLNLGEVYGTPSWFLPIPATYVIDKSGIVRFAYADPDFRLRAEPDEIMAAVAAVRP